MYAINDEILDLFRKEYRQVARITYKYYSTTYTLTEADILQGGLTIDRAAFSGSALEIGATVASQLNLKLSKLNSTIYTSRLEQAWIFVEVGIKKWDAYNWENATVNWIPMGYFKITDLHEDERSITITALDRMILFDDTVNTSLISLPMKAKPLIARVCEICGVEMEPFNRNWYTNELIDIEAIPEGLTYRQVLQDLTFLIGAYNAYITHDGKLAFKSYVDEQELYIDKDEEYKFEIIDKYTIIGITYEHPGKDSITAVTVSPGNKKHIITYKGNGVLPYDTYYGPDAAQVYDQSGNLVSGFVWPLAQKFGGEDYFPFSAITVPMPQLDGMDVIRMKYLNERYYRAVYAGHCTFTLNGNTNIDCLVDKPENKSYQYNAPPSIVL